ncbi:MAG: MATE family efflux transporter [SAR324 cluster bacterium]|nr:MATE family efflux transporter [SAR324 cluster bacterium]
MWKWKAESDNNDPLVARSETQQSKAKFVTGSTMRHVVVMSLSSSIGLMALFLVDLIDMYFLSLLGEIELASAIGYAGSILFFTTSVCIGLAIAMGALVSKAIGAGDRERAKCYVVNVFAVVILSTAALATAVWILIPFLVELLGARGRAADLSIAYLRIMIPSMPVLGLAITSGAALRAVGDAKRSMYSTLSGGAVNAVLDPIFIFGFNLGVEGAAIASVFARFAILAVAFYPLYKHHRLITRFQSSYFLSDLKPILAIGIPAILTNIATPFGNAYVTASIAEFGNSVVAGMSIVGRLLPVAFGIVFAVSGAVGPIIGQNYGANNMTRVQKTITDALLFLTGYVTLISIVLIFSPDWISSLFNADPEAAAIVRIFCLYVGFTYIFAGTTFVGNAAFNNLGKANYSTVVNWGKATIGTIPFVYFGALWYEAAGVILGQALGNVVFGILSVVSAYALVNHKKKQELAGI